MGREGGHMSCDWNFAMRDEIGWSGSFIGQKKWFGDNKFATDSL